MRYIFFFGRHAVKALFHPMPIFLGLVLACAGLYLTHHWVQSGENFARASFQSQHAVLAEQVAKQYEHSIRILKSVSHKPKFTASALSNEESFRQLISTLQAFQGQHAVATAWFVPFQSEAAPTVQVKGYFSKEDGETLVISDRPLLDAADTTEESKPNPLPKEAFSWNAVEGSIQYDRDITDVPEPVLSIARQTYDSARLIVQHDPAHIATDRMFAATPALCANSPVESKACLGAIVFELEGQQVLDSLKANGKLQADVSVGLSWELGSSLFAAQPIAMSVSATPEKDGILQAEQRITIEGTPLYFVMARASRFVGSIDRAKHAPLLYLIAALLGASAYFLSALWYSLFTSRKARVIFLEQTLERKERQLQSLSDAAPFGVLLINPDQECFYANTFAEQLFQRKVEELQGTNWLACFSEPLREKLLQQSAHAKEGSPFTFRSETKNAPGSTTPVVVSVLPLQRGKKRLGSTVYIFQDELLGKKAETKVTVVDEVPPPQAPQAKTGRNKREESQREQKTA